MLSAFKDSEHATAFEKDGCLTFPLLSELETETVLNIYQQANGQNNRLQNQQFYGVNYSLGTLSAEENDAVMKPVVEILYHKLQDHFVDFELLGCVFITKPPHTSATFVYHQDWNYTNEKKIAFATCWVPLCNTSPRNGCMSLIKGSHHFFETYRSASLTSARIEFDELPEEMRTDVEQEKGSCLAFHQAVFHGSHPNVSDNSRPVLAFVVKPKNAPIVHYVKNENKIEAFEMSTASFNSMLEQIPKSEIPSDAVRTCVLDKITELPSARQIVCKWRIENERHRLIKSQESHKRFMQNGFVVLRNVLSNQHIELLIDLYKQNFKTPNGMYVSHHAETDAEKNQEITQKINACINSMLQNTFHHFQPLLSHFASKGTGADGVFNFHQDWSIVQEELFGVLHCWIPLQNVNKENGTLAVLPCSHLLFHNYRSGTCPIRFTPIEEYGDAVVHIEARPGDIVVYHPALFHGSGANQTDTERLAVVASLAHEAASKVYYQKKEHEVHLFELTNKDLFSNLDYLANGGQPEGKFLSKVPYRVLELSNDDLHAALSQLCKNQLPEHAEV